MSADLAVQIFLADPARQDQQDLACAWAALDDEERARAERLHDARDRQTYVVAHALLRCVLARRIGGAVAGLRFRRTPLGRPELDAGCDAAGANPVPSARFNLSHTRGLVGCAVTATADVGFDIEEARQPAPLEIAPRYFSRRELAGLHRLPPARQPDRFYALWTFKEAYIKGRGLGLTIPLDSFTVEIDTVPRGRPRLVAESLEEGGGGGDGGDGDVSAWTLRGWRLERHAMALAVRGATDRVRVSLSTDQRIGSLLDGNGRR